MIWKIVLSDPAAYSPLRLRLYLYRPAVGFQPGGASLHSIGTPHGPDTDTFVKASQVRETEWGAQSHRRLACPLQAWKPTHASRLSIDPYPLPTFNTPPHSHPSLQADLKPEHFGAGMAFMFETNLMLKLTDWALSAAHRDIGEGHRQHQRHGLIPGSRFLPWIWFYLHCSVLEPLTPDDTYYRTPWPHFSSPPSPADYQKCWQGLPRLFDPSPEARVFTGPITAKGDSGAGGSYGFGRGRVTDKGAAVGVDGGEGSAAGAKRRRTTDEAGNGGSA